MGIILTLFLIPIQASGQFTELKVDISRSIDVVVTAEVALADGSYVGHRAWTQFQMSATLSQCSGPFGPGQILTPDEVDANLSTFSSIPILTVTSHWTEDLSWVEFNPFPTVIYSKHPTASGRHSVPKNVAGEATSYLKFIVDYYDSLPRSVIFLHSHRYAYHQEDLLVLLYRLDADRDWSGSYCNINHAVWGYKVSEGYATNGSRTATREARKAPSRGSS